jgi:peptidoglycan hydrolase CwlO-like protein
MPVWETALWFTLVLVILSFLIQILTRKHVFEENDNIAELSKNNRLLAEQLSILRQEIMNLNDELKHLTSENHNLNQEVQYLTKEVARIRSNICIEDCGTICPLKGN